VFLDEISRCRPETQNKLFSVIHEKRAGARLPKLRYRWAAMNPPLTAESDGRGLRGLAAARSRAPVASPTSSSCPALADLSRRTASR
jgi:hypothetical protein